MCIRDRGSASVEGNGRERRVTISGVGTAMPQIFQFNVVLGEFLPDDDPRAPRALAVLGSKVRKELYGDLNPLGDRIRIGGDRYRVIGVMEPKGTVLGFDLDDTVYIPAARGLEIFNRESLMEIDVLYAEGARVEEVNEGIRRVLIARHGGEDFTITTQQQMLDILGSVLEVVTFYPGFRQSAPGKYHIRVCRTLSCAMAGSGELMDSLCDKAGIDRSGVTHHEPIAVSEDGQFSIEFAECLASCGTGPVCLVNDDFHEGVSPDKAEELLNSYSG